MHSKTVIIVHGGAGAWHTNLIRLEAGKTACEIAAYVGQKILLAGGSALDAVEAAVRSLEDHPALNAGRGSYVNASGDIETDALIMDGRSLDIGAVAAVQRIYYPISLARELLNVENTNLLVGRGAERFADNLEIPRCDQQDQKVDPSIWDPHGDALTSDTVGAVARDAEGNLAAATSSGGTKGKLAGRVGDVPLAGSGAYADNLSAAASATGRGEELMKILISKQVCDYVTAGLPAQEACQAAIKLLDRRVNGTGGIIAVDTSGCLGFAYNTNAMPVAYAIGDSMIAVAY